MIAAYVAGHRRRRRGSVGRPTRRSGRCSLPRAFARLVRHARHHARRARIPLRRQPRRRFDHPAAPAARGRARPRRRVAGDRGCRRAERHRAVARREHRHRRRRSSRRRGTSRRSTATSSSPTCRRGSTAANTAEPGVATPSELWLDAAAAGRRCRSTSRRSARSSRELRGDPLARGAIALLLVTALVALVLAAVGLLLTVVGDLRDERGVAARPGGAGRDACRPAPARAAARGGRRRASGSAAGSPPGAIVGALVVAVVTVTAGAETRCPRSRSRSTAARRRSRSRRSSPARAAARDRSGGEAPVSRGRGTRSLPALRHARGHGGRAAGTDARRRAQASCSSSSARAARARARCCASSPGSTARRRARCASSATTSARSAAGRSLEYRSRTLGYADQHYTRALAPELTARELVGAAARAARRRRARSANGPRTGCSNASACSTGRRAAAPSSRADSSSGWRSAPRSRTGRSLFIADEPTGELDAANATRDLRADPRTRARRGRDDGPRQPRPELGRGRGPCRADPRRARQRRGRRRGRQPRRLGAHPGGAARRRLAGAGRTRARRASSCACASEQRARARASAAVAPGEVVARTVGLSKSYGDAARLPRPVARRSTPARLTAVTGPLGLRQVDAPASARRARPPDGRRGDVLEAPISQLDATQRALAAARAHRRSSRRAPTSSRSSPRRRPSSSRSRCAGVATTGAARRSRPSGSSELAQQRVARLSMGERQRVAVARALAARPEAPARRRADGAARRGERTRRRRALRRARARRRAPRSSARRTIPC